MTCLETLLTREQATLRRVAGALRTQHRQAHPPPPPKPLAPQQQRSERRARRYARYEQVVQLKAQGWSQRAIAQETGLHPQTAAIYLKAGQFPERAPHPRRSRVIEPYLDYLHMRWEQGKHNGRLRCEEIRAQGYPAGLTEVSIAIQPWRTHGPTASLARAKEVQQYPSSSPKQTLWLLFKEKRTNQEQQFVQSLLEQSALIGRTYESTYESMSRCVDFARSSRSAMRPLYTRGRMKLRRLRALSSYVSSKGCAWIGKRSKMRCSLPAVKDRSRVR